MARAAYVVRDDSPGGPSGNVDKLYPYTLKGLVEALEEARFRSFAGPPQVVVFGACKVAPQKVGDCQVVVEFL